MDLDEYPEDLVPAKSVLTALGFMTKASVASIKTARAISNLEKKFTQMVTNNDEKLREFHALKGMKSFTPGMEMVLFNIITYLNGNSKADDVKTSKVKLYEQCKKVCHSFNYSFLVFLFNSLFTPMYSKICQFLSIENIIIEETSSGQNCRILCPLCDATQLLSSTVGRTGKTSFSIYNFSRHFNSHNNLRENSSSIDENDYEIGHGSGENIVSCMDRSHHTNTIKELREKCSELENGSRYVELKSQIVDLEAHISKSDNDMKLKGTYIL